MPVRCVGSLIPPRFPADLEQLYAAHKIDGISGRCLLHAMSYTVVMVLLALSFVSLASKTHTLFAVTYRVQVAALGIAALLYAIMFVAHKQGGALSRQLRSYNDAAQTVAAIFICMVAPVVEPYRLMRLLGSTLAEESGKLYAEEIASGSEGLPGLKATCGGWVKDAEPDVMCSFASYEALVMAVIIHVMASAAIFGRVSPRWIFFAWHWNFAWYVFVRAALGDVNSHDIIFRQDACILYLTLMMLYLSGRRVDELLRAEFLHTREVEQRVDMRVEQRVRGAVGAALTRAVSGRCAKSNSPGSRREFAGHEFAGREFAGSAQELARIHSSSPQVSDGEPREDQQKKQLRRANSLPAGNRTSSTGFSFKPHASVDEEAPAQRAPAAASRASPTGCSLGPGVDALKAPVAPLSLRPSRLFTPVGTASDSASDSAPSVGSDTMTQSSVGSLPFAWPRARPVEEGDVNRPACYPVAEGLSTKGTIDMRKLARQAVNSCRRQAKGSRQTQSRRAVTSLRLSPTPETSAETNLRHSRMVLSEV